MTDLHDVARAVSLTRLHEWGTEAQVLLALASEPAPFGEIRVGLRDLAHDTGLGSGEISRAIRGLVRRKVLTVDPGRGQEPSAYWIRPPAEWGLVPWRLDRRAVGAIIDASFGLHVRALDLDSARAWTRARRRSVNGNSGGPTRVVRASGRAHKNDLVRASRRAHYDDEAASSHLSFRIEDRYPSSEQAEKRATQPLNERERRLVDAFKAGTGMGEVYGTLLAGLRQVANEANGELERICRLVSDPAGPRDWNERLSLARLALVETQPDPRGRFVPGTGWVK